MQHEQNNFEQDDLAEIWRSAQHRRTEDVYSWFTHIFEKRRKFKSPDTRPHYVGMLFSKALLSSRDRAGGSQMGDRTRGGRSGH
jgi:hypothetical protein